MKKIRFVQTLMIATILLIVCFQVYYVSRLYHNEWQDLKKETDVLFRETVYKLQLAGFKRDTTFFRKRINTDNVFNYQVINALRQTTEKKRRSQNPDSPAASKNMVIRIPGNAMLREKMPTSIRVMRDSLGLASSGKIRILTSGETGPRLVVSRILHDSLIRKDSLFKKAFIETFKEDVQNAPRAKAPATGVLLNDQKNFIGRNLVRKVQSNGLPLDGGEVQIFTNANSVNDSLPLPQLDSAYKSELKKVSINVPYELIKSKGERSGLMPGANELKTMPASVGIFSPYHYQATFGNPYNFLLQKIAPNIFLSVLLVAFTLVSFIVLYKNLMAQRRLAVIKNDFISNITHELKTPIATVNVAIEAMKSFNVLNDTKRTQEYLDISASELQRLSLLVDKVLKLSMFEKNEIQLNKEWLDLDDLINDVINRMRLQFEKNKAVVSFDQSGEKFSINADRLHITSVVYNLLDNALKYSKGVIKIDLQLTAHTQYLELKVKDNGIGIGEEYKSKIFEQFFRVPSGDRHNIKGYGLGLSYVNHIVKMHHGIIELQSEIDKGSTFIIKLPYDETPVINFDKDRIITKDFFNRNT